MFGYWFTTYFDIGSRFTDQKYCTFAYVFRMWATNDTKTTLRDQIILWFLNFSVIHDKFQISGLQNKRTKATREV